MLRRALILCCLGLLLAACTAGPRLLPGNRLDYNRNIQRSNEEELLLNIVRMRYYEQPFFLQVGSISSNFGISAGLGAGGQYYDRTSTLARNSLNLTAQGSYAENPTITYTPVQGETHAKRLLAEIGVDRLALFVRAGWHVDDVFRLMVERIASLENDFSAGGASRADEGQSINSLKGFLELCAFLRRKQISRDLTVYGEQQNQDAVHVLEVRLRDAAEAKRLGELLGGPLRLAPSPRGQVARIRLATVNSFVNPAAMDPADNVVPIRMRSFLETMVGLASGVQPSAEDVAQGAAVNLDNAEATVLLKAYGLPPLIVVRRSAAQPQRAAVAAEHRGAWFYVDDADTRSKALMMLLGSLYALQSGDVESISPLLTIPVN
mgnify:CR=1 FL=1